VRFKKLDLNLLVALDVLLKEQSITRAAEQLSLSPSAMSNSLFRLREYFDDDLLTKMGRKMEITPLGIRLQQPVRDALIRIESTILLQPSFDPQKTDRVFSILCSDYTQMVLGPYLMALIGEQKSTAKFQFLPQTNNPNKHLEQGEADLLIIPSRFMSPDHPYEVLYEEGFVCLVWSQSDLAKVDLTLDRYNQAGHVMMQPNNMNNRKDHFEYVATKQLKIQRRVMATTYSFTALPTLVIGTENIATVHARLANKVTQVWPIDIRPLPLVIEPMKQCLQWHHYKTKDAGLVWLRELMQEAAKRMDA